MLVMTKQIKPTFTKNLSEIRKFHIPNTTWIPILSVKAYIFEPHKTYYSDVFFQTHKT